MKERISRGIAPAALTISIIALVVSTTGLAGAALGGRERPVTAVNAAANRRPGTPTRRSSKRRALPGPSTTPRPLGLLRLNRRKQFPASAIPLVSVARSARSARSARNADRLGGRTLAQVQGSCAPTTIDLGSYCIDASPYPVEPQDAGDNDWFWATRRCSDADGYLPSAAQLIGAVTRLKLESSVSDSELTSSRDEDPADGSKDQREMTSNLITTTAGGSAAGSQGVSDGSRGDPRQGEPDPVPLPANPSPETLQYITVYDNADHGGFAGAKPVSQPENFRCAYAKTPGAEERGAE
ncbi:hypothetical protein [Conexibacter sp. CPCC 206217]|uniref:hypothetical protein n=1 Tax=Conexibacter sp. CPCC 206217 TaxID=3064574 RepID=UPI00272496EE|nr:hypothetical protein [Conexibacter sp. CPCC 206217]MDO8209331.1 hypothetical protein [Conexibacter sp. CPCC 206217]